MAKWEAKLSRLLSAYIHFEPFNSPHPKILLGPDGTVTVFNATLQVTKKILLSFAGPVTP